MRDHHRRTYSLHARDGAASCWAFKSAAVVFAGAAVLIQWRRAEACSVERRPNIAPVALWLVGVGVATYVSLYLATKFLSSLS